MLGPVGSAVPSSPSTASERLPITGVVLAGGRSRRMGRDKALVRLGGQALVERLSGMLAQVCEGGVIVAAGDSEALAALSLPEGTGVLADAVAHQGPLGGLATALSATRTEWAFVAGVDMPFVRPEVVRALWTELAAAKNPAHVDVVMPVGEKGPEPLLALYRRECLGALRDTLAAGERRVTGLHARLCVREVPVEALRAADPELVSLVNVNTAEDLAAAERLAADLAREAGECA
jgi:molybdopterin-guanine dinucleotide biosynthesis protein A